MQWEGEWISCSTELTAHRGWYVESVKLILYVELPPRHPRLSFIHREQSHNNKNVLTGVQRWPPDLQERFHTLVTIPTNKLAESSQRTKTTSRVQLSMDHSSQLGVKCNRCGETKKRLNNTISLITGDLYTSLSLLLLKGKKKVTGWSLELFL